MKILVAAAVLTASIACSAERGSTTGGPVSSRVDSAGIEIVTSREPAWRAGEGWMLAADPFLVIAQSDTTFERTPLDPASVFLAADGTVMVGDGLSAGHNAILVYDSAGVYLRTIGRDGDGPCEFGQLYWAVPYRGDSIAAHDYAGDDIHIFDSSGRCVRTVRVPPGGLPEPPGTYGFSPGAAGVFEDGSFLVYPGGALDISGGPGIAWYRHELLRLSADGLTADTLGVFRIGEAHWGGGVQHARPVGRYAHKVINGNELLYATSESFEVSVLDPAGRVTRIIRRPAAARDLTAEMRATYIDARYEQTRIAALEGGPEAADRTRSYLEEREWPTELPFIGGLLVDDDGNIWAGEFFNRMLFGAESAPATVAWSVFSPDGEWLGDVTMPARFTPRTIQRGNVFGTWLDGDDVKSVRAYRIEGGRAR